MAEKTKITWTDYTFNPWIGCTKVAPGCEHCYADAFAKRYHKALWGPEGTRVKTSATYWQKPLKWNRDAETDGVRRRVFCASLADVFEDWQGPIMNSHGQVLKRCDRCASVGPDDLKCTVCDRQSTASDLTMDDIRRDLFTLIDQTPHLDWLQLTKRPENVRRMWPSSLRQATADARILGLTADEGQEFTEAQIDDYRPRDYRPNVWLGTSVSDQTTANRNVPLLLNSSDLCTVLFLSCEPLLGPLRLTDWLACYQPDIARRRGELRFVASATSNAIDWVIVGGESGPQHRPMDHDWARSIRDQCRAAGVPFFFKQRAAARPGNGIDLDGQVLQAFPVRCPTDQ